MYGNTATQAIYPNSIEKIVYSEFGLKILIDYLVEKTDLPPVVQQDITS